MNFKEHAKSCQEAYLNDLNTLVSIESTRDLSTATKNAPFGQNCRKVLDAMLDMAKRWICDKRYRWLCRCYRIW